MTVRANVPGGLLLVGDIHIRQGHGEPSGTAAECQGRATLRIHKLKGDSLRYYDCPQVEDETYIASIGVARRSLSKALKNASMDMVRRICHMTGMTIPEAVILAGQCLEVEICQMTGEFTTICAMVKKRYLTEVN